ncbi:DNA primase [Aneurinibacillus thermoaerophilus]|uniref:DNA primase n=1 Tax=Aneurinibacillus thermoaerophilus TaxID=143495 RepID=A0A1G7Z3L0_ANETH|nr:DNA primase [Aneurinibacillus thermoaerophilus]MED0674773.1 DNA primase [Aneurinibacillus thermoaerophilus]MED0735755.1 DNA primase [Aneurinibacillus thermoaerophilus]QYY41876.1 DNA primase [Aneurinibacillus thermoaerophilus]SDH03352.1 DNA primase [Aneurinibacillus thermoaerophilus]
MAGRIPEDVIEQVRAQNDIMDVVGQYVHLKKTGRNYFGLCPFHSEKSPSFAVHPDKQIFRCYGCGESGNVFSFIMKIEGLEFPEAVHNLAQRVGIDIPREEGTSENEKARKRKESMLAAHDLVAKLYHHLLLNTDHGSRARNYLLNRQMQLATIEEFGLGYSLESWDFITHFLEKRGFSLSLMEEAGLLSRKDKNSRPFDRFRGRVMFPIHDSQGRVVAFGARTLGDEQPKYLNSPETPLFNKSQLLFNLHRARAHIRRQQEAILFEGYVDVISAWQAGVHNGIASLGTSLTEQQARLIRRNAESVILCYDSDQAGIEAAFKGADLLVAAGCTVKVAQMPKGMDPDDYIRQHGGEKFKQEILLNAFSLPSYRLQVIRSRYALNDETERMKFIHEALEEISRLPSAVERDHYLRQLADEFHLSLDAIKQEQRKIFKQQKKAGNRDNLKDGWNNSIDSSRYVAEKPMLPAYIKSEQYLLVLMMHSAEIAEQVQAKVGADFAIEDHAALAAHLYRYYAEGYEPDVARFISYLQDEKRLVEKAAELATIDVQAHLMSPRILEDYMEHVIKNSKRMQIEKLEKEKLKYERMGNTAEAVRISLELIPLKRALK